MRYRAEIDGLRAVAVVPVMLFHAGFSAFGGGFVGVDVFFVISGYLITSIILGELEQGRFSLVKFYERRARRILPALFLVVALCLPFAWLWLLPKDLKDFSASVVAVFTFVSNVLFWRQSGYFATAAELKPMLHTWSLAVEEQFYLFFPLFLIMAWRVRKSWILGTLVVASIVSLALAEYGARTNATAAFFLLPTRAWELSIGCLTALYLKERLDDGSSNASFARQALGVGGLLLILSSVFFYGKNTPFPSLYALAPTVGTALIILFATPNTLAGKVLGARALVGLGLISYSAYLWHQPLFAFARHRILGEPSAAVFGALIVVALVAAFTSWRFVERPFRQRGVVGRTAVFSVAGLGSVGFIAIGVVGIANDGFEGRNLLPPQVSRTFERTKRSAECFDRKNVHASRDWLCPIGVAGQVPSFVVFGDSHSLSLLELFDSAARKEGRSGVYTGTSGCPPLIGVYALRADQRDRDCNRLNQRMYEYVKSSPEINKVILIARWTYYTDGGYGGTDLSYLGLSPNGRKQKADSRAAFEYGVKATSSRYGELPATVYIIEQAPQQELAPQQIYREAYRDQQLSPGELSLLSVSKAKHKQLQSYVARVFRTSAPNLRLVTLDDVFCREDTCLVGDLSGSYYFDDDHLSLYGASLAMDKARRILSTPASDGAHASPKPL